MPDPQATRKVQKRTLDTREAIVKAALQEFADLGFDGASTRAIAQGAGVKHTSIAHHFGNKEGVWRAAATYAIGLYVDRLAKRRAGLAGVDDATLLRLLFKEFILFSAELPAFHRFMVQTAQGDPERLSWLVERHIKPLCEGEAQLLTTAQNTGMVLDANTHHLRYVFIGAVTTIFTVANEFELISGIDPCTETFVDQHIDLILRLFMPGIDHGPIKETQA